MNYMFIENSTFALYDFQVAILLIILEEHGIQ